MPLTISRFVPSRTSTNPVALDHTGKDTAGEFAPLTLRTDAATAADAISLLTTLHDSAGNDTAYGEITTELVTPTDASELAKMVVNLMVDGSTADVFTVNPLAGDNVQAIINSATSGGDPVFQLHENGAFRYGLTYNTANARFALTSHDTDGGGADGDIIRIPDGQLTVDGNATFDDNAFDWVCGTCYWHGGRFPEDGRCPTCGESVDWHDDAKLLHDALHTSPTLRDLPPDLRARMDAFGIVRQHEDGAFVSMNRSLIYLMNCIAQLWAENQAIESRIERLEAIV